jgi:hypothetical protein
MPAHKWLDPAKVEIPVETDGQVRRSTSGSRRAIDDLGFAKLDSLVGAAG